MRADCSAIGIFQRNNGQLICTLEHHLRRIFEMKTSSKVSSNSDSDELWSSSDDEQPVVAQKRNGHRLSDSSSSDEEEKSSALSISKEESNKIESGLLTALGNLQIEDKKVATTKRQTPAKLDESALWSSDEDEESDIVKYRPAFRRKSECILLDDSTDDSPAGTGDEATRQKRLDHSPWQRKKWRLSVSRKEYAISELSDSTMPNFRIPERLFQKLYDHQKEGVAWMAGLHVGGVGGLLGCVYIA